MPELPLTDVTLHYEITGNGPPLLLIPGMVSDSATWLPLMPFITAQYTVIRPDNRTTGRTVPWNAPASVDHFATDCAALLQHLALGPAHVMGHSMGGMIAMRLARAAPDLVASVTLLASAPLRMARNVEIFDTLLAIRQSNAPPGTWLRALFPWIERAQVWETPGAIDHALAAALAYPYAQSTDAMAHQIDALRGYTPDDPAGLPCPAQALLASSDLLIPLAEAQQALGPIPAHVIDGAGHALHWDAPAECARYLKAFTEGVTR